MLKGSYQTWLETSLFSKPCTSGKHNVLSQCPACMQSACMPSMHAGRILCRFLISSVEPACIMQVKTLPLQTPVFVISKHCMFSHNVLACCRFLDSGGVYKLAFGPKAFIVVSDPVVVRHLLKVNPCIIPLYRPPHACLPPATVYRYSFATAVPGNGLRS